MESLPCGVLGTNLVRTLVLCSLPALMLSIDRQLRRGVSACCVLCQLMFVSCCNPVQMPNLHGFTGFCKTPFAVCMLYAVYLPSLLGRDSAFSLEHLCSSISWLLESRGDIPALIPALILVRESPGALCKALGVPQRPFVPPAELGWGSS